MAAVLPLESATGAARVARGADRQAEAQGAPPAMPAPHPQPSCFQPRAIRRNGSLGNGGCDAGTLAGRLAGRDVPRRRHSEKLPDAAPLHSSTGFLHLASLPQYPVYVPDHKISASRIICPGLGLLSGASTGSFVIPRKSLRSMSSLSMDLHHPAYCIDDWAQRRHQISSTSILTALSHDEFASGDRPASRRSSAQWEPPTMIFSEFGKPGSITFSDHEEEEDSVSPPPPQPPPETERGASPTAESGPVEKPSRGGPAGSPVVNAPETDISGPLPRRSYYRAGGPPVQTKRESATPLDDAREKAADTASAHSADDAAHDESGPEAPSYKIVHLVSKLLHLSSSDDESNENHRGAARKNKGRRPQSPGRHHDSDVGHSSRASGKQKKSQKGMARGMGSPPSLGDQQDDDDEHPSHASGKHRSIVHKLLHPGEDDGRNRRHAHKKKDGCEMERHDVHDDHRTFETSDEGEPVSNKQFHPVVEIGRSHGRARGKKGRSPSPDRSEDHDDEHLSDTSSKGRSLVDKLLHPGARHHNSRHASSSYSSGGEDESDPERATHGSERRNKERSFVNRILHPLQGKEEEEDDVNNSDHLVSQLRKEYGLEAPYLRADLGSNSSGTPRGRSGLGERSSPRKRKMPRRSNDRKLTDSLKALPANASDAEGAAYKPNEKVNERSASSAQHPRSSNSAISSPQSQTRPDETLAPAPAILTLLTQRASGFPVGSDDTGKRANQEATRDFEACVALPDAATGVGPFLHKLSAGQATHVRSNSAPAEQCREQLPEISHSETDLQFSKKKSTSGSCSEFTACMGSNRHLPEDKGRGMHAEPSRSGRDHANVKHHEHDREHGCEHEHKHDHGVHLWPHLVPQQDQPLATAVGQQIKKVLEEGKPGHNRSLSYHGAARSGSSQSAKSSPHEEHDVSEKYGKVEEVLGKGAEATVSLAHKRTAKYQQEDPLGQPEEKLYAIKRFRKRRKHESQRDYIKKVTTEFCISSNLRHCNIVETVDLIEDDHLGWCEVMEYVPGGSLFDRIASGVELDVFEVNCFFRQLVNGVVYLHSMGVVHRDLKPENPVAHAPVLLNADGCILKIADFGVSEVFRIVWEKVPRKLKGLAGSEPYIAPEEFLGIEFEPTKVDVWACGIIYYTMVHHAVPFLRAVNTDELYARFLSLRLGQFPPIDNLASGPRNMLNRVLEPDPDKRITADAIKNDSWFTAVDWCTVETKGRHHTHKVVHPNGHLHQS